MSVEAVFEDQAPARAWREALFEEFCDAYPKRAGDARKRDAKRAFKRKPRAYLERAVEAASRYARFCDVTGKTGTEFVKQMASFVNSEENLENEWQPPESSPKRTRDMSAQEIADDLLRYSENRHFAGEGPTDQKSIATQ